MACELMVVVVEREDEVARQLQDLVAEGGQDGLEFLPKLQGAQEGSRILPEALVDRPDGRYQVRDEANRIVIPLVQRDPGYRKVATSAPIRKQGRLAETCRRGDDGEVVPRAFIQPLVEARTRYGVDMTSGHVELGPEQLPTEQLVLSHIRIVLGGSRDPERARSAAAQYPAC